MTDAGAKPILSIVQDDGDVCHGVVHCVASAVGAGSYGVQLAYVRLAEPGR
jgi:hypothetical protein